ncbi:integrase core domain-containing protein [Pararhodobacter zhoushanensis]|uniref:integrase core domain-containing protein n=1 Tax=Pararhodobacter zhoushanensis TaxID=2479545 RepID=UPI000F8DD555|nr:integrase core domain-containing protein [Pararhodobacter zhoushanensis]
MGQVRHGSATTTHAVRAAIQRSLASLSQLSRELGINSKTVAKWRKRVTVEDMKTGPTEPRSTVLTEAEEAAIIAFRRHTLLPLDDCLYALQPSIPQLTRSTLHRCLQRHGISRLPDVEGDKPNHPWTNGQVERINRTIKDATVKRFHYENHDQLRTHLANFLAAYNFARRLKTLSGLTPYEYICKIWTAEPDRFTIDPIHQRPGLNT